MSAQNYKFLQIADELEVMKPTRSGVMKNFNISCLDDFFIDDSMAIDNVLTSAERQMIIKHAIDSIKANEIEKSIPGYENILLYHGRSIINACVEEGLIVNILALRDEEYLKKLKPWYSKPFHWQPLNRIRDYFGEGIGMYFAFVGRILSIELKMIYLIRIIQIQNLFSNRISYDCTHRTCYIRNISILFGR